MPDDPAKPEPVPDGLWTPLPPFEEDFQYALIRLSHVTARLNRGTRLLPGTQERRRRKSQLESLQQQFAALRLTATLPVPPWKQQEDAEAFERERQEFIAKLRAIAARKPAEQQDQPPPAEPEKTGT